VAVRRQPAGIFARFTDQARQVVSQAAQEAQLLRHGHVGTEHLLLALVFDDEGLAAKALESLGLSLGDVRQQVTAITGQGEHGTPGRIPFTPQAKRVLELALREALGLGRNNIGTEHVLLGLLRLERGIGARVLTGLGAGYDQVRERVAELASQREQEAAPEAPDMVQAILAENEQLHRELDRLRAMLRDHGIEPDGGTARSA
jgi:ATP-dependent Clp protease ATP-binding subunit ClpC